MGENSREIIEREHRVYAWQRERSRFVDGKLAERWARVDFEDIKRQLTRPIQ